MCVQRKYETHLVINSINAFVFFYSDKVNIKDQFTKYYC